MPAGGMVLTNTALALWVYRACIADKTFREWHTLSHTHTNAHAHVQQTPPPTRRDKELRAVSIALVMCGLCVCWVVSVGERSTQHGGPAARCSQQHAQTHSELGCRGSALTSSRQGDGEGKSTQLPCASRTGAAAACASASRHSVAAARMRGAISLDAQK